MRRSIRAIWIGAVAVASCSDSEVSLDVSTSPDPIPVRFYVGGGLPPASFPPDLSADWTLNVRSDVAGEATVTTSIIDAANDLPLPDQEGTVNGDSSFALPAGGSTSVPQHWRYLLTYARPLSSQVPARLAFQIKVRFVDETGAVATEELRVLEAPRDFSVE